LTNLGQAGTRKRVEVGICHRFEGALVAFATASYRGDVKLDAGGLGHIPYLRG
jgi:hypothetical protein